MVETFDEYEKRWDRAFLKQGHRFRMAEDGPDRFVTSTPGHNGPGCRVCGWSACWYCCKPEDIPKCEGE